MRIVLTEKEVKACLVDEVSKRLSYILHLDPKKGVFYFRETSKSNFEPVNGEIIYVVEDIDG